MKKQLFVLKTLFLLFLSLPSAFADEGMWLTWMLTKNYEQMNKLGLKLTPEQIYSVNNSSLKDGVVNFGGFCTGEVISAEGLVLTNHHCGFEAVQSHSTVEHDYLTNGFWAMDRSQELQNEGLTATFLVRVEDVTEKLYGLSEEKYEAKAAELVKSAIEGTHYEGEIKSFYEGNQFYLFIFEVYKDIRLVGAPPSSVGKFGGDTDNWMWPRHTGDFSMFRIYTGPDGKPAEYSANNIPLVPRYFFPISVKGISKDDYAMVMGYPGSTERYQSSEAVKLTYEQSNPARIKIRQKRLAIMKEAMDSDPNIRIQYASNYAKISNYYKYFIGQNQGLRRLDVIHRKEMEERAFMQWVDSTEERQSLYGDVLANMQRTYVDYRKVNVPYIYLEEAAFGSDLLLLCYQYSALFTALQGTDKEAIAEQVAAMQKEADTYFKDHHAPTDQKIFAALMEMYYKDVDPAFHPAIFAEVQKKYKGDFNKWAAAVFKTSIFADQIKMNAFLKAPTSAALEKDPGFRAMLSILNDFRAKGGPILGKVWGKLEYQNKVYMKGLMEWHKNKTMYPDANFSMRLTYGTVQDYNAKDAVHYDFETTLDGIMEKEDSTNDEFVVPAKLRQLYAAKDYGRYANKDGKLPVCFITTNDITGGNSGSPVINGEGHIIGVAFDGNWEAMSGDIVYEPGLQRCIAVDVRYVLFMVEKYAGAGHLIKEMKIIE